MGGPAPLWAVAPLGVQLLSWIWPAVVVAPSCQGDRSEDRSVVAALQAAVGALRVGLEQCSAQRAEEPRCPVEVRVSPWLIFLLGCLVGGLLVGGALCGLGLSERVVRAAPVRSRSTAAPESPTVLATLDVPRGPLTPSAKYGRSPSAVA
jgi:hypothetical protein